MAEHVKYAPAIARHFGTWEGRAFVLSPEGEVLDRHATKLEIGAREKHYSQRNTYTWADGRPQRVFEFPGLFDDGGHLWIGGERLKGECSILSDDAIVFTAAYKPEGDLEDVTVSSSLLYL